MRTIESVAALSELVEQDVAVSDEFVVTQDEVDAFAELTGDRQWIHTDPARAAAEGPFGGAIVHGFLTVALFPRFFASAVSVKGARLIVNMGTNYIRFPSAIRVGSQVKARIHLKACKLAPKWADATWLVSVEAKGARLPSCLAEWNLRYYLPAPP
jgi:acyl dehydratase